MSDEEQDAKPDPGTDRAPSPDPDETRTDDSATDEQPPAREADSDQDSAAGAAAGERTAADDDGTAADDDANDDADHDHAEGNDDTDANDAGEDASAQDDDGGPGSGAGAGTVSRAPGRAGRARTKPGHAGAPAAASAGSVSRLQRTTRGLLAALSALFVLTVTAGVLSVGLLWEAPAAEPVQAPAVDVGAGPLALVCSDTPRLITDDGGDDIDYDAEFGPSPEGVQARTDVLVLGRDGQAPGEAGYQVLDGQQEPLSSQGQVAYDSYPGAEAPGVLIADPSQGRSALGAGSALARADEGDLRGLSAAPCQTPSATAWLVGGSTELGSSARLTLTNPGQTPVSAEVAAWGETGPVENTASVLVPPGAARVVLLETLSLEERLAVRVTSDGGRLAAVIQDSALQGVVPAGTDMVSAAADPATQLHLGPLLVPGADEGAEPATLRLVNPAEEEAEISVTVLGAEGAEVLSGAEEQVLEAGTVTDISLAGVPAGAVGLRVDSDVAVTGSVLLDRTGEAGELDPDQPVRDHAWIAAQDPANHGLLMLPGAGEQVDEAQIALTNPLPQDQTVQARTVSADGEVAEATEVQVPAEASVPLDTGEIDLADTVAIEVTGEAVLATATLTAQAADGELITVMPLTPDADIEQRVAVRLGTS